METKGKPEEKKHSVGNGQVKGGELGKPSLIGTKWDEKELGKIEGERKDEGGKKVNEEQNWEMGFKREGESIQELRRLQEGTWG